MVQYKHRDIASLDFLGERVDFVAVNERVRERVENLSHERDVLEALLRHSESDDVFWDVGSCLGIHSFVMAKHLKDGMVYSSEPMYANCAVSIDNKAVNELENVFVGNFALSDEDGEATFEIRESIEPGYGRHGLASPSENQYEFVRQVTVETKRGDTAPFEQPNLVKIDVEGASPLVLQGMKETLEDPACRVVVLETHEPNPVQPSHEDFGMTREDIISFIESCGFTVGTLENDFHLIGVQDASQINLLEDATVSVEMVQGDIAEETTDVIVNSAGTSLRMGTGVAGALKRAGGTELYREALETGPIELGTCAMTDSYDLSCETVIHAASMPHYGDGRSSEETIRASISEALQMADSNGHTSISVPAVGCGLGGVSLTTGVRAILQEVASFTPNSLEQVRIVLYSDEEYQAALSLTSREV